MDLKKYNATVAKQYVPEMYTELISQRYEPKLARLKSIEILVIGQSSNFSQSFNKSD